MVYLMDLALATPEPVTPAAPRPVKFALLTQHWRDVSFLHWTADPESVAPLMPPGTRPDVIGGTTYVGLVALRMARVGFPGLPAIPYLGWFPEINVRLYSVGPDGRRGVVFCSMEASRLVPAAIGRAAFQLPYQWARMRVRRGGDTITYTSRRRWPGPGGCRFRLAVRVGERITEPSPLEHFLTARWGLHAAWYRHLAYYLPTEHPPWSLRRAQVTDLSDDLLSAAGLPVPAGEPVSVLYAAGVPVRAGPPRLLAADRLSRG
jgi:uncharacterized protein YqjF (DUF2071 family)